MIYAAYDDLAYYVHLADDNSFEMSCAPSVFSCFSTNLNFDVLESDRKPRVTQPGTGIFSHFYTEFDW